MMSSSRRVIKLQSIFAVLIGTESVKIYQLRLQLTVIKFVKSTALRRRSSATPCHRNVHILFINNPVKTVGYVIIIDKEIWRQKMMNCELQLFCLEKLRKKSI